MMPSSTASLDPENVVRTLPDGWAAMLTAILATELFPQSVSSHLFFRALAPFDQQQNIELTATAQRRMYYALSQAYAAASTMRSREWAAIPSGAVIKACAMLMRVGCAIRDHVDTLTNHRWVLWQMLRGQLEELLSARINHEAPILLMNEVFMADQRYGARIRGQPYVSQWESRANCRSGRRESRGGRRRP